ncbi:MAG: hypothetical protein H0W06_09895 [Chloroflexia bacterium]|nr:hypothetical protein [Chloroflexia bacterium]
MAGGRSAGRRRRGRDNRERRLRWLLPALLAVSLVLILWRRGVLASASGALIERVSGPDKLEPLPSSRTGGSVAGGRGGAERAAPPGEPVSDPGVMTASPVPPAATPDDGGRDQISGDGSFDCPADFPIKGNATSKIYHVPGGSHYGVTRPNVCFRTPEAAERAGFRASKASPIRSVAGQDTSQ